MQGMNMVDLVCPALRVEHIDDVLADLDREVTGAVVLSSEIIVHGESAGPGCKITGDKQEVVRVWPKGKGGDGGSRCKRGPHRAVSTALILRNLIDGGEYRVRRQKSNTE